MPIQIRDTKPTRLEKQNYPGYQVVIILVYSQPYFVMFYNRHCLRYHPADESTILVLGENAIPDLDTVKNAFIKGILSALLKCGTICFPLESPLFIRQYHRPTQKFISQPAPGFMTVEDCRKVSYAELEALRKQGFVLGDDIAAVKAFRASVTKENVIVRDVWYLGHIGLSSWAR